MSWYEPSTWFKKQPAVNPEQGVWFSGIRDDYDIDTSLLSLTPEKLAKALKSAALGDTSEQYEIFDIVEQDPQVQSNLGRRRNAAICDEMVIAPAIADDAPSIAAAEFCTEAIKGISNWDDALFDMTDAIAKGIALSQIVWNLEGGKFMPRALVQWPQRYIQFGDPQGRYLQDQDEIRIITDEQRTKGEPLGPRQWICHIQKTWSVPIPRAALMRSIVWFFLFKRFGWKDWSVFLERVGVPLRVGKYNPGATSDEKASLMQAVINLGRDAGCIMPTLSSIELLETKGSSAAQPPHSSLITFANEEISKAVWGNTMASDQGDKGARSAKEAYSTDEETLIKKDKANLASTIKRDLITPLVELNLGENFPIPNVTFPGQEAENLLEDAQIDKILTKDIGLKLPVSYFYEKYSRPEPEDGEEVIGGITPPAPNPFAPAPGGQPPAEGEQPPAEEQLPNSATQQMATELIALAQEKKASVDWLVTRMLSQQKK
jgi:phage gp29-like protein